MPPSLLPATPVTAAVRVMLVDDSELVRRGIKDALTSSPQNRIAVVAEAANCEEARQLWEEEAPDVILLDIRLPDGSGLELAADLIKRHPNCRIIILTSHQSDQFVYDAVRAGVQGYLLKEVTPEALVRAIHDAMAGKSSLDPQAAARVLDFVRNRKGPGDESTPLRSLSPQERRVLALVAVGKTNKEIAKSMQLSNNTVKNYMGSVFEKLQVSRRSQAAAIYVRAMPNDPQ